MSCTVYVSVRKKKVSEQKIQNIVDSLLRTLKKSGEVSVHIIGDKKMRTLNVKHRGKNRPTDVLSFPIEESWGTEPEFGDIFICLPQIFRQSRQYNIPFFEEFVRMLTHGTLHLLGYDHEKPADAQEMFSLQEKYVKEWI